MIIHFTTRIHIENSTEKSYIFIYNYCFPFGRTIAHAASLRLPTAAAHVRVPNPMWDLWTNWHWRRFSPNTSVSPANSHSTNCSTLIIYHPGLVQ
jgi:hypothetical protein